MRRLCGRRQSVHAATASLAAMAVVAAGLAGVAFADDDASPSREEVERAQQAVTDQRHTVASVEAGLVAAGDRLDATVVASARATEDFNEARAQFGLARKAAEVARSGYLAAERDVDRQQAAYEEAVLAAYTSGPELTTLNALVGAEGIDFVIEETTTLGNAEQALQDQYDAFRAAATKAEATKKEAVETREEARRLKERTRANRDLARAAEAQALSEQQAIEAERRGLVAELARLEGTSVRLAERRQKAIERRRLQRINPPAKPTPTPTPTPRPRRHRRPRRSRSRPLRRDRRPGPRRRPHPHRLRLHTDADTDTDTAPTPTPTLTPTPPDTDSDTDTHTDPDAGAHRTGAGDPTGQPGRGNRDRVRAG